MASICLGWCIIPIPATTDKLDLKYILNHSESSIIVTNKELLKNIFNVIHDCPNLRSVICMDDLSCEENQIVFNSNIKYVKQKNELNFLNDQQVLFIEWPNLIKLGKDHLIDSPSLPEDEKNEIFTITYTSGSTGRPKGAIKTYEQWNIFISTIYSMPTPLVRLSFMPLAHNTERHHLYLTLTFGGKMCFSKGNMEKFFEELQIVNPTIISAAPRFYDIIFSHYKEALIEYKSKTIKLEENEFQKTEFEEIQSNLNVLKQFNHILGNSIQVLIVGGAICSKSTHDFIQKCFNLPLFNGYGTTESGGITADGYLYPGVKVKLVDCIEMGYTLKDQPWPRGELLVKTSNMITGYYKDDEITNGLFKDGWFVTGDIVEKKNDQFIVIDRKKNLFKLSQGIFISPTSIENKLILCNFVNQIFVYGDHTRSNLVAIVVPNINMLREWATYKNLINLETSDKQICSLKNCNSKIQRELIKIGRIIGLPSYHIPASIYLEHKKWSVEDGLMTPSEKMIRSSLEKKYFPIIDLLYSDLSSNENKSISSKVLNIIKRVVQNNVDEDENIYSNLATDSLSTLKLINILNKEFETNINIQDLIHSQENLTSKTIENMILQTKSSSIEKLKSQKIKYSSIEIGSFEETLFEDDKNFCIQINPQILDDYNRQYKLNSLENQNILLTGVTGFLGFHIFNEILKMFKHCFIFTLIKCKNIGHGFERIEKMSLKQKIDLPNDWKKRTFIIVGDLSKPLLGLDELEFNKLCQKINLILHIAAIVNWIWNYSVLRQTNVVGTQTLLILATRFKLKPFIFVSSISTSSYNLDTDSISSGDCYSILKDEIIKNHGGYAITKWVSELIVRRHISLGLPGCVIRPGMISGHSKKGSCNLTDFNIRFLRNLIFSNSYFESQLKLEWIPVDFCSHSIIKLTEYYLSLKTYLPHVCTYHIQNPNTITYSELSQIIIKMGYNLKLLSYQDWRVSLSENNQSPLWPLIHLFGLKEFSISSEIIPSPNTSKILLELGLNYPKIDYNLIFVTVQYMIEILEQE